MAITTTVFTGLTVVAVIAVALVGWWLNRAWLQVTYRDAGWLRHMYYSNLPDVQIYFHADVQNRSHRANRLIGAALHVEEPSKRTYNRRDLRFDPTLPVDIPARGSLR